MASSPEVLPMRHFMLLASLVGAAALAACTSTLDDTSTRQSIACYDTAHGVMCITVATIDRADRDVDADGRLDHMVCGDTASESDSASDSGTSTDSVDSDDAMFTGEDDSDADGDGVDDDGDSMSDSDDTDSDSESNADCAGGDSVSDSASASDSTIHSADSAGDDSVSDGDSDSVADGMDCDCVPPPPPPDSPPQDPPPPEEPPLP
jgi:hypothetical protein